MIIVLALVFQGCSTTPASTLAEKPHILHFRLDTVARIPVGNELTTIANFFQPHASSNCYFLDDHNFNFFRVNTDKATLKRLGKISGLEYFEGFSVDEANKELLVVSEDSLLIYQFDGTHKQAFSLSEKAPYGYLVLLNKWFQPIKRGNKLYMHYFPNVEASFKDPDFFKQPIEAEWDLATHKVRLIAQDYPTNNQLYCYGYNYAPDRFVVSGSAHGYSFPYNDSLFIRNLNTGKEQVTFFGSRRKKEFRHIPFNKLAQLNESVFDKLMIENSAYQLSGSAPLSGYYYRTLAYNAGSAKRNSDKKYCMIIFDRNFKYLGESELDFITGIVADSHKGLTSISKSREKKEVYISRFIW